MVNIEKIVLTSVTLVEALAYYSVAYTFANMATLFSISMVQSLPPSFSQLIAPEKRDELNNLFSRSLRVNMIRLLPMIILLAVSTKPFFTIWAGENFERESTLPFYILLIELSFNMIAYVPFGILLASGKNDVFAKIFWVESAPYILLVAILTNKFGAVGVAAAWSLRILFDALVIIWFARKLVDVSMNIWGEKLYSSVIVSLVLLVSGLLSIILLNIRFGWTV